MQIQDSWREFACRFALLACTMIWCGFLVRQEGQRPFSLVPLSISSTTPPDALPTVYWFYGDNEQFVNDAIIDVILDFGMHEWFQESISSMSVSFWRNVDTGTIAVWYTGFDHIDTNNFAEHLHSIYQNAVEQNHGRFIIIVQSRKVSGFETPNETMRKFIPKIKVIRVRG